MDLLMKKMFNTNYGIYKCNMHKNATETQLIQELKDKKTDEELN